MLKRLARLFVIKSRLEAYLVIYAIAMGAVLRGDAYLQQYPGAFGLLLFAACLGVVFLAGAKLLDAVRPADPAIKQGPWKALPRGRRAAPSPRHARRRPEDRRRRIGTRA